MNDLLSNLESQFGREDTYAYADDLSEIVTDEGSALSCIHTVKHWAQENGLELNMKTSMGLMRSVSSEKLLALSDMLSPREQATKFLIRTTRKLISIGTPSSEL